MAQYEVTLRDYWRILRRRKGFVTFASFLLGFFSFVLAQLWQPIPEYTANAKIQIQSNQSIASLTMESYGHSVDTYRVLAGAFETDEGARAFLGKFDRTWIVRR